MNKESFFASGRFELWRRLLLLFFIVVGLWLYMYASPAPIVRIRIVDFAHEQARETSGHFVTDQQKHLGSLPLQDYIDHITADTLIELEGSPWSSFVNQFRTAAEGRPSDEWEKRIQANELERGNIRSVFFSPEEEDMIQLMRLIDNPHETVYLKSQEGGVDPLYLRMDYITFTHSNFSPGSGYTGLYEPPAHFFRPFRPFAPWIIAVGFLLYLFLLKPRPRDGAMVYSRGSVIGADVAGLLLFTLFYGIPLFVMGGSVQALTEFLPGTIIFWGLALFGLWIFYISAWYASYALTLEENQLVLSHYGGELRIPLQEIVCFQPAVKKYPKWLTILFVLSALASKGAANTAGSAGRALITASAAYYGTRIYHKDGSWLDVWYTHAMGGEILRGSSNLMPMLENAGVNKHTDTVVDYTVFFPKDKGAKPKNRFKATLVVLMLFALVVTGTVYHTNQGISSASAIGPDNQKSQNGTTQQEQDFVPAEYPEFAGLKAVIEDTGWMKFYGGEIMDYGVSAIMNDAGEYITAGTTTSFDHYWPALYLVGAGEDGALLWETTHTPGRDCNASSIIQTNDGGYGIITTVGDYTQRHAHLIKTGANGKVEWEKGFRWDKNSSGSSLVECPEGGFIIAGNKGDHSYILNIDPAGKEVWLTPLGTNSAASSVNQVLTLPSGGYLVVGSVLNPGTTYWDVYLAQISPEGNLEWERAYHDEGEERGRAAVILEEGTIVVTGYRKANVTSKEKVLLMALDEAGEIVWKENYPAPGHDGQGVSVQETPGGGFVILANSFHPSLYTRASLLRTDAEGNLISVRKLWDDGNILARSLKPAGDNVFIITGMIENPGLEELGNRSMFLKKFKLYD